MSPAIKTGTPVPSSTEGRSPAEPSIPVFVINPGRPDAYAIVPVPKSPPEAPAKKP
jgi:hypothetical protein